MKKVYIITWEELYADGNKESGISYVFDTLEKAQKRLEEIKQDEIQEQIDNGREEQKVKDLVNDLMCGNGFVIDFFDEDIKYEIIESEVE